MPRKSKNASHHISTLNESPLHRALKKRYSRAYDRHEVLVDGFVVDIVRGERLIEIQTGNFSAIRRKLTALAAEHEIRLVYPIARETWIVREDAGGGRLGRRRSPKRGSLDQLFEELVSVPRLLAHPNFSLEVLFVQAEEIRRPDPRARRRKGWAVVERRLIEIVGRQVFESPADLVARLPAELPEPFTTADLAEAAGAPRWLARKMAYCLREMGAAEPVGKRGNALLYRLSASSGRPAAPAGGRKA